MREAPGAGARSQRGGRDEPQVDARPIRNSPRRPVWGLVVDPTATPTKR